MNEAALHDLLARAYNLIAAALRDDRPDFDRVMDAVGRLLDPKGPFNTPTMTLSLPPSVDRAILDLRGVMERFRDASAESTEEAVREIWSVLSRPEVVKALKEREAFKTG
ncbi:hypothetical protein PQJ75_26615 [Rhodoplanes sp. TEM]|uniref:Uncharacterized protein n=1 Tax=Rhodoplanes tepidamans TaxID=200616 RepID=A0ABT5J746_RHOTP|nr:MULTISPECIES: hypothetical protein [Rhodoplanes]MDC7785476.1 hypothetical protein [Rhodoplanes tepidamans]MDC7987323.1 hypothetical protein [Rhodoplanes sp. TEM]MDQ0353354.1 hypothetical protein [Rhodoplanes tepidamans]